MASFTPNCYFEGSLKTSFDKVTQGNDKLLNHINMAANQKRSTVEHKRNVSGMGELLSFSYKVWYVMFHYMKLRNAVTYHQVTVCSMGHPPY